jgi:hypothetical protein
MTATRRLPSILPPLLVALIGVQPVHASELDAIAISTNIRQFHMPYGTVLDPVFASSDPESPEYSDIVAYTRAGDSAIWTGHYLAAEAFRFRVTQSPDALSAVWQALLGIGTLLDVTGTDVLARCLVPADSPYAAGIQEEEGGHGIYYSTLGDQTYFWIGNTSRDQYSGVMFGLSVTYDLVEDPDVRAFIQTIVTRLVSFLLRNNWNVVMPDGTISTTFLHRPDQLLAFLQIARQINPPLFSTAYVEHRSRFAALVSWPIQFDNIDEHSSYHKFNLNYANLYSLVRLEENESPYLRRYLEAYGLLRRRTEGHANAHFNMVDRALAGENHARDAETSVLLEQWLQRPRRDYWIDLQESYAACDENRACSPIPVNERVNTDFLWQRSPFQLYGGGGGTIETSATDYILPYWMGRYYDLPV